MSAAKFHNDYIGSLTVEKVGLILFLSVGVTIVLFAVFHMDASICPDGPNTPIATVTISRDAGGNYSLLIAAIEPDVSYSEVHIEIYDRNRMPLFSAELVQIAGGSHPSIIQFNNTGTPNRTHLDSGDSFYVISSENGGYAEPGTFVRITYDLTEKSIAFVELT